MILSGRVWKLGDDVGATDIVSPLYDSLGMSRKWAECAKHLLEELRPEMVAEVRPGDIIVAGKNLGVGHAHYYSTAIMAAKTAGIAGMFGQSVSGLFQRAAIDFGVPMWPLPELSAITSDGDRLEIDLATGAVKNHTTGREASVPPFSPILLDILGAGGSEPWALRRVGYQPAQAA